MLLLFSFSNFLFCSLIFGHRINISKPVSNNLDMNSHLWKLLKFMFLELISQLLNQNLWGQDWSVYVYVFF